MTKVQLPLNLSTPLDEQSMSRVSKVLSTYGILRVQAQPGAGQVIVEYDATRFTAQDVQAVFARAGLPLARPSA